VLKTVDVLIGLTVIILALSMAVTVITQTITTIINTRGRHLRRGLVDLLQQLDPALSAELSKSVATTILRHPLVSGSTASVTGMLGGPRLGSVVHREEFTKLLMALAIDREPGALNGKAKEALIQALTANGVENPAEVLKNVRQMAMQLERSSPELSHMARQNLAILHAAESDLVAKINNWFDQTMDRTSQRFTASTRMITFVGAFIVAFALQVDTPAIVNRLSADDQLRQQLVRDAETLYAENAGAEAPAHENATAASTALTKAETDMAQKHRAMLSAAGLVRLPSSGEAWLNGFGLTSVLGMLLTALLLSLGAPFWYSVLGKLLQLRSVLAVKDDKQRAERQMNESAPATTAAATGQPRPTAAANILAGERGDLSAIG
jgi:hypothetical protein